MRTRFFALAALALSLAACTKGNPFTPSEYPMELTAGELQTMVNQAQASTRATVDDDWNGVSTVAVQVGNDVKSYNVTSADGGKTATLSSDNPFYWENTTEKKTVIAWHPYSKSYPTDWTVKADQSTAANYQASDLIKGELKELAFADRNDPSKSKMTFAHQTAKIVVNLISGDGVALDANTFVKLNNLSGVDKGSTITPYKAAVNKQTYLAFLKEQTLTEKSSFIQVTTKDGTFLYELPDAKTFKAGTAYTYDITVKANGIEVTEAISNEWTDGGSEDIMSMKTYTASDLKLGDYYYSDGTWSDGGLRARYTDGTMKWEENKPQPESGKTVIGMVFYTEQHPNDKSDYSQSGIGQKNCHGYAVAQQDATSSYCMWGLYDTKLGCYPKDESGNAQDNFSNPDIDWSGYAWTQEIITAAGGKDKLNATTQLGYPATWYAVVAYEDDCPAPTNSSGWFLPSIGQMNLLTSVDGISLRLFDYWSSSEICHRPEGRALSVDGDTGRVGSCIKDDRRCYVRPVLAF